MRKITLLLIVLIGTSDLFSQVIPYKEINTDLDEYGSSFRVTKQGTELWYTIGSKNDPRSRELATIKIIDDKIGNIEPVITPINVENNKNRLELNGDPVFGYCQYEGYFVSNRLFNGDYYSTDIYKIEWDGDGFEKIDRVDILNSENWEDSPNLSPNKNILFFASDRATPRQGRSDIWFSVLNSNTGEWKEPIMFSILTKYHNGKSIQTPFASNDGYLYYSTNDSKDGDYDIWRVKLESNGVPSISSFPEEPEILDWDGVNLPEVDDSHPSFSPGGGWFIFTSNRDENGDMKMDRDLFYTKREEKSDELFLNVNLKTRQFNEFTKQYEDTLRSMANIPITLTDLNSGKKIEKTTDSKGKIKLPMLRYNGESPEFDKRIKQFIVTSSYSKGDLFIPVDTLIYDTFCKDEINHTLTLTDTAIYNDPDCSATFSQKNVQFFVTNYYCPSTWKYQDLGLCTSIFANDGCTVLEVQKPVIPCKSNELWDYNLKYVEPTVEENENNLGCVNFDEINNRELMLERSEAVDQALDNFIEIMVAGLKTYCVERSFENNETVNVYVMGFADPRSIRPECRYQGPDIDFKTISNYIGLKDMDKKNYLKNGILKNGTLYRGTGSYGNQLLTDLRAFHTAWMLDKLWAEYVPNFKELREQGLINIIAEGVGVDSKERKEYLELRKKGIADQYLAEKRKVNVRFQVPRTKGETYQYEPVGGGKFVFCGDSHECMPEPSGAKHALEMKLSELNEEQRESIRRWDFDRVREELAGLRILDPKDRPAEDKKDEEIDLPKPPQSDGTLGKCWTIQFATSLDKELITSIYDELQQLGQELYISEFITKDGSTSYRLRTGCWKERKDAIVAYKWIKSNFNEIKNSLVNLDNINIQIAK